MNTYVSSGEVDLTVIVLKSTGEIVGRYRGRERFDETFRPNSDMSPGERLNHAFSAAVQQIREKILADSELSKVRQSRLKQK
jgi:hypothetical protein